MDLTNCRKIDWAEFFDVEGNAPYFVHIPSRQTQREEPTEMKEWKEEQIISFLAKSNWRKREHEGKVFYYDKLSGSSVWEPPPELVEFESSLVKLTQEWYQENARCEAETGSSSQGEAHKQDFDYNDDNWVITGSRSDDGYGSDRTPPDQSPNFYSPQYDGSGDEMDVEGGYFYDEHTNFVESTQESKEDAKGSGFSEAKSEKLRLEEEEEQRRIESELLEKKLSARDAVMEPDVYRRISRYLELSGKDPSDVVNTLCKGYVGYAQLTHLVCDWIDLADSDNLNDNDKKSTNKERKQTRTDQFIGNEIAGLIKSRFNSSLADRIMDDASREPEWLVNMMKDPAESRWRRLLIELSDEHKESILINWCIRELSRLGYHREIAQVIKEADYFSVCNELLVDTLNRLGSAIAEGGSTDSSITVDNEKQANNCDINDKDDVLNLMKGLKRMCGSTEYMFLYTNFLLTSVMGKLQPDSSNNTKKRSAEQINQDNEISIDDSMNTMWLRKVRRIQEELNDALVWNKQTRGYSSRGWKPEELVSKSLLAFQLSNENVAVEMRKFPNQDASADLRLVVQELLIKEHLRTTFVDVLFGIFFQRGENSLESDMDYDKSSQWKACLLLGVADDIKSGQFDDKYALLDTLNHPQVLHLIILHLVGTSDESTSFVENSDMTNFQRQLALLLALSSYAHDYTFKKDTSKHSSQSPDDYIQSFYLKIMEVAKVCQNLGTLISNRYSGSKSDVVLNLLKNSSLLSRIFLSWLEVKVHEKLFVIRAKQHPVYPVMMQMLVLGIDTYVAQREHCFQIIRTMFDVVSQVSTADEPAVARLDHDDHHDKDDSEVPLAVRKDLIDITIHLMGKGFITEPLAFVREKFNSIDKGLVRYFFSRLLGVISPPFTKDFVRRLTQLLLLPRARECVESFYFSRKAARSLSAFYHIAFEVGSEGNASLLSEEQRAVLTSLVKNTTALAKGNDVN